MMKRLLVVAATPALLLLGGCEDGFKTDCEAQGGLVDSHTAVGTGVGVGSKGTPVIVTTTSTTRYCIVDGKIVGVD